MQNCTDNSASNLDSLSALRESLRIQELRETQLLDTESEAAYDGITELAAEICAAPASMISLVDEVRQWFKSVRGLACRQTGRSGSICAYTIQQASPLVIPDLTQDQRFDTSPLVHGAMHIRSYAGVPIRGPKGNRLGSLCVIDFVPRTFSPAQVRSLQLLALQVESQIALRLEMNAKQEAVHALEASKRRFQLFMDHTPVIAYIRDAEGRMRWYNRRMAQMYGVSEDAWLGKSTRQLWPEEIAATVEESDRTVLLDGVEVHSETETPGPQKEPLHWRYTKFPFTDASGERFIGGLAIEITDEKKRRLELENVSETLRQGNESLRRASLLDPLTKVGNRRCFDLELNHCYTTAVRQDRDLSMILLDIDRFKQINDTHGHTYGDAVLREVGTLLQRCVRETDHLSRFGGEEFAILLPTTEGVHALELARRICNRVRQHAFSTGRVTISAGVATTRGAAKSADQLLEEADVSLYRAKRGGRDQAVAHSPAWQMKTVQVDDLSRFDFGDVESACGCIAAAV